MQQKRTQARGEGGSQNEEFLTLDPLTGLGNDYLFRLFLPREYAKARKSNANGALIAIKLDNIIEINILHGRTGGDEALRAVAQVLSNYREMYIEMGHLVFRLGGPVFGYYIPACTIADARAVAEGIDRQVLNSDLYLKRLTVSMGISYLSEFFIKQGTPEELALAVEFISMKRLRLAEEQGMNTICDTSKIAEYSVSDKPVVLVVEPDLTSIELLLKAIEAAGFIVKTCGDGESALSAVRSSPPKLIISEVMTPRLNGFTLREKLRTNALWNAVPFILISHKKNEEYIKKAVERDIRFFFRKPLSVTEIVGLISNITRSTVQ